MTDGAARADATGVVTSTAATVGSAADVPAGAERVEGRFELVALVKRGNGIDTYSGIDQLHGADVVIKTVETASSPDGRVHAARPRGAPSRAPQPLHDPAGVAVRPA